MQNGKFIDLLVAYGPGISHDDMALVIINAAEKSLAAGATGVGYLYSANYGQTVTIERTYFTGGWDTGTSGANQAQVVMAVEAFLGTPTYQHLQGILRILPITTMDYNTVPQWNADIHIGIIYTDLKRIENYLMSGWDVLGIQDQHSDAQKPYAIGGTIADMGPSENDAIQQGLIALAKNYPSS